MRRCRLLELPLELREPIYHFVFLVKPDEEGYVAVSKHSYSGSRSSVLSLLATSRQINTEAASIFYSINKIALSASALKPLHDPTRPLRQVYVGPYHRHGPIGFLAVTSMARLQVIHTLRVTVQSVEEATMACNQARKLASLRDLELLLSRVSLDRGDFHNHGDLHFLKRAVGKLHNVEHLRFEEEKKSSENTESRQRFMRWTQEIVGMLPKAQRIAS